MREKTIKKSNKKEKYCESENYEVYVLYIYMIFKGWIDEFFFSYLIYIQFKALAGLFYPMQILSK